MRGLLLIFAMISFSSQADVLVSCDFFTNGKLTNQCDAVVSDQKSGKGIWLKAGTSFYLSNLTTCELDNNYDLKIKSLIIEDLRTRRLNNSLEGKYIRLHDGHNFNTKAPSYEFTVIYYKKGKKKRAKKKNKQVIEDHAIANVSGVVSYIFNGTGVKCSMANE